jgi:hypothetical protein
LGLAREYGHLAVLITVANSMFKTRAHPVAVVSEHKHDRYFNKNANDSLYRMQQSSSVYENIGIVR